MANVELIYDGDCPNVANARANLLRAFAEAKHPARWVEWKRSDPASPPHVRGYGSPTVLVDGRDVAGVEPSGDVTCCRLYTSVSSESSGAPPVEILTSAMRASW